MTLEETLSFIEAKETGKRSASRLLDPHSAGTIQTVASRSQYKRLNHDRKQPPTQRQPHNQSETCFYCGAYGHGAKATAKERRTTCKAFGHRCNICDKEHHFESVCRRKDRRDATNSVYGNETSLCSTSDDISSADDTTAALRHHTFDNTTKTWTERRSRAQPLVEVNIAVADCSPLGYPTPKDTRSIHHKVLADTGCQSCLTGTGILDLLNVSQCSLIEATTRKNAADNRNIPIIGALPLTFTGTDAAGCRVESRQLTYFTGNLKDTVYLNREACTDLGMVSNDFPTIREPERSAAAPLHTADCGCPIRQPPPPPPKIPFSATEDNRDKLKAFLLDHYKASTFNTCPHQPLPMMEGPPLRLNVDPNAEPTAYHKPIPVPLHWQEKVKAGLDQDVQLGVIEEVPIGDPVTWCHRMVICAKNNGEPRRTVDFQALNIHAVRETHHTPSPFLQARSVPCGKKKSVLDAWNGYHSVPIREEDRHLTTFITPWGRYRYRTAPQGYIASGDAYTRRYDAIVSDIPNKTKCVDDSLLWADDLEGNFHQVVEWLDVCGRHRITLNPEKFQFGLDTVEFAGFEIGLRDVRPAGHFTEAIRDFPTPRSITDVRSWFGLLNQISYTFSMAPLMQPFRNLLTPQSRFEWTDELERLFQESKRHIIDEIENACVFLIRHVLLALLQTGQNPALDSGFSRSTAPAIGLNHFVAKQDGR